MAPIISEVTQTGYSI